MKAELTIELVIAIQIILGIGLFIVYYFIEGRYYKMYKKYKKENMKKWIYNMPSNNYFGEQTDWNQTLLTKFNQLAVDMPYPLKIEVPNKFKELIESLGYYNENNMTVGIRYIVEFIDSEEDIIYVCGKELFIDTKSINIL